MSKDQSFSLFLPPLNNKARVRNGNAGEWHTQTSTAFEEVADSLYLSGDSKTVNSIPDMWARPLLMEMILKSPQHPQHAQMKAEWKGMIAAIALAELQGLKLKAELIDFRQLQADPFINSLQKLIPDKKREKSIYLLDGNRNPWEKIYVFFITLKSGQDVAVGMTSPTTIVCPAEDGEWNDLPWWSNGKLHSPIEPEDHLTEDEKIQLWLWLKNLVEEIDRNQPQNAIKIIEIISEFQNELLNTIPKNQNLRLSNRHNYFGVGIDIGALKALNNPIGAKPMASSVALRISSKQSITPPIIIPETTNSSTLKKDITQNQDWKDKKLKDIWIYDTTNLQNFNLEEFKKKHRDVSYLLINDLFLEDFYYIKDANKLPGACLPTGSESITYRNHDDEELYLTPLLPISSRLLDYFTPEELTKKIIELQSVNLSGNRSGVRVVIKLPLVDGNYVVSKEYPIEEKNAITKVPFLEVWPNFRANRWQEYYTFYFDNRTEEERNNKTFYVSFANVQEIHPPELKNFQITRLQEFPAFILCQDQNTDLGLILLKTPDLVGDEDPNKTWMVGVDFGTSFTHVYYKTNRQVTSLTLSPSNLRVTATSESFRSSLLTDYFMSAEQNNLPLSTVLTTRGNQGQDRIVFDGRVYISENIGRLDPNDDAIKIDLKWETELLPDLRLFLRHLSLMITAEAVKNNARSIEWNISYPSAFSRSDKSLYFVTWQNIIEELSAQTGILHQWLPQNKGKAFRSESLAIAHYFAEAEDDKGRDLVSTTCIDMGGGTSDISIWVGNRLIHQCSVLLGGKWLFSQFIRQKPNFINEQFGAGIQQAEDHENAISYVQVDAILLQKGKTWLKKNRPLFDDDPDLQYIVQRSTIGIAGLYYYVGLILQSLHLEGKYKREGITPVYIGGNGSQILHWLDRSGTFSAQCDADRLFSRMLSKGSGFPDTKEETLLSSKPKAEVACGLVLNQRETRLKVEQDEDDDVIAGEDCYVNGNLIPWKSRFCLTGTVESVKVQDLTNLRSFLDDYHAALIELRITNIKPLKDYQNEEEREKIWRETIRLTEAELLKMEGLADEIRVEPPFILGLKSLLRVLARR
ncbi:hypothetical protein [Trichormus variabilis]|uniref:Uncharacterized protein n=1 Tax=Trichormus variabilis SAG 1403-4b TaxID=447716 RepID=A0A433UYI5_ANAVA|nr:hypothetical protein [Trichormus variabilis]MBD2625585.1 hypothetical protein [Trichormus variabilis FACHB-164]RUS98867.1 hypothetical protein DSM107003_08860 [Trichormus variabilis SAG 1403-4b]